MSIEAIKNKLPDYAKDIKLNISSLANEDLLSDQQKWGAFLASALATRNHKLIYEIENEAAEHLSPEAQTAAKAAHGVMSMNNVYYRFVHISSNKEYQTLPAKLRMNILANPGVEKVDFELWSLAVSAINACGMCIDAHEKQLIAEGMSKQQIQAAVRIAATIHAAGAILDGEDAASGNYLKAA